MAATSSQFAGGAGDATHDSARFIEKSIGWILTGASLVAFAAALVLMVEKLKLMADPNFVPSCSINPVLSCGSIMESTQAEAFGFPTPRVGAT